MNRSEQIGELAAALAKAQGAIEGAKKDKINPFFEKARAGSGGYADLASVWAACREPLSANGLAIVQFPALADGAVKVTSILMHASGEWMSDELTAPLQQQTPQAVGLLITYLRRYALSAIAGVAPEDDDAEAAMGRAAPKNGNGHSKPNAPAPIPPEEQLYAKLSESLEAIGEFMSLQEKEGWRAKHSTDVNGLPAYLKKDLVDKFTKMPVKA